MPSPAELLVVINMVHDEVKLLRTMVDILNQKITLLDTKINIVNQKYEDLVTFSAKQNAVKNLDFGTAGKPQNFPSITVSKSASP